MKHKIEITVNGEHYRIYVKPCTTLAEMLRDELHLTGVKVSCNSGDCGSCTVILDGKAVRSCIMLAVTANGKEIITIEGLANEDGLHPLQQAFVDKFAVQCGYCTPGMILTAKALLDENPEATEKEIRSALDGNICRCTSYIKIVEAIKTAQEEMAI